MSVRVSSRSKRKPPTARAVAKRKVAAKRAKQKRPTKRRGLLARLGWGSVMLTVIAIGVAVFAFSRLNVDETIRELTLPLKHEAIIRQQAREKDVPADLIAAVINVESGFADQTSEAGARGLMQITPDTADLIESLSGGLTFETDDLADPDINIRYGTFFLRELLDRYDGNVVAALAGYNAGPGNADAWGGASMEEGDIRFPETRSYVDEVLDKREAYRETYERELGL